MVLELESKNIGGNIGNINLKFNEGINIIRAPNTTGKTSIVRGIGSLFVKNTKNARDILNLTQRRGEIRLEGNGQVWQKTFKDNDGKVTIEKSTGIVDDRFGYLIADYHNQLLSVLNEGSPKKVMEGIEKFITVLSDANSYVRQLEIKKEDAVKIEDFLNEHTGETKQYLDLQKKEIEISKKLIEIETVQNEKMSEAYKSDANLKGWMDKQKIIHNEIIALSATITLKEKENENLTKEILSKQNKIKGFSAKEFEKIDDKYQEVRGDIDALSNQILEIDKFIKLIEQYNHSKSCPMCDNKMNEWSERKKELNEKTKEIDEERIEKTKESEVLAKEYEEWKNIDIVKKDLEGILQHRKGNEKEIEILSNTKGNKFTQQKQLLKKIEVFRVSIGSEDLKQKEKQEELEKEQSQILSELRKMEKVKNEIEEKRSKLEEIQIKVTELKQQYEIELHKARQFFNNEIKEVLNRLAFKDFRKVEIEKNFDLVIDRADIKRQPLTTLSGSERTTIGLMLLLSAHRAYIKQIPIFLADETTFSYDPTRFKRFAIYLKRNIPYTILTALAPEGEPLKVEMMKE